MAPTTLTLQRRKAPVSKIVTYIILSFWALTTIYPFVWVILNSFKDKKLIRRDSFSLPVGDAFTLGNYAKALDRYDVGLAYRNSLVVSVTVTLAVILLAGLASYGMARYNFKGKRAVHSLIIASMMFPVFSTIIPVFRMLHAFGLAGTNSVARSLAATILPQIAGNLSFAIIVLMGYIRSIPIDLEEAAYLEGCSTLKIFFKVIIPVARPSFATVAIFAFLWSYNDLFTQNFFLSHPKSRSITLLLNEISSQAGVDYGLMAAAVVMIVVPVLVVYIFLQKNIIKGLTAGAVKG